MFLFLYDLGRLVLKLQFNFYGQRNWLSAKMTDNLILERKDFLSKDSALFCLLD
jgi:hypothetical protein